MSSHILDISKYTKVDLIGRGGFGDVYKIQDKKSKELYAAKVAQFELDKCSKEDALSITREVNILNQIVHASIVRFCGYSPNFIGGQHSPVIVTEYCKNGSLYDIMDLERRSLSHEFWDDTKKLINIYGIASGMAYLHSNNIIHRDLKPGNILMDDMLFPKIADFGLSKVLTKNSTSMSSTTGVKGTLVYIAPEIFESTQYSFASDVYAFGFILYEIMTNEQPYKNLNQAQILKKVLNDQSRPKFTVPIPNAYRKLIERCWSQNPRDRPSFAQIVELLKTGDFITDSVNPDDFEEYTYYIEEFHNEYKNNSKILNARDFIKSETKTFRKVTVKKDGIELDQKSFKSDKSKGKGLFGLFGKKSKPEMIYPQSEFSALNEACQKLVQSAIEDSDACFQVGQNLIENKNNFPQNTSLGIKYLKSACKQENPDASYYLSKLYYDGQFIPQNLAKSKKCIKKFIKGDRMDIVVLYSKINKEEGNFGECIKHLKRACNHGYGHAMYEYGKMYFNGDGVEINKKEARKYFEMAQRNGFSKAAKYLSSQSQIENDKPPSEKSKPEAPKPKQKSKPPEKMKPKSLSSDEKNRLGEDLLNGNGSAKNPKEAARLFQEAAREGHIRASYNLGICHMKELGVPIDLYESARLFRFASDNGDTDAMEELGLLYLHGLGVIKDLKEAIRLFRLGTDKGGIGCARQLSICYSDGTGVEKDQIESVRLLRNGASKNDPKTLNSLGYMYYFGYGVSSNIQESFRLTKLAADMGWSGAINNLASYYIEGEVVEQDIAKGIRLIKQAAESGGIFACRNIALKYRDGKHVSEDINEAMHYYRLAASYNDIQSINEIDCEIQTGMLKDEDKMQAITDIRSGHERGNVYYTVSLGICYEYGEGVRKDLRKAYDLYKEAYQRGSQRAIFRLGLFYESGTIVRQNMKEALRLYKIASDWGYTRATNKLALCYRDGKGVAVDSNEAYRLLCMGLDREYQEIFRDPDRDYRYDMAVIADTIHAKLK